jgi:eukaryotic-like serine/threonine-protein kinase
MASRFPQEPTIRSAAGDPTVTGRPSQLAEPPSPPAAPTTGPRKGPDEVAESRLGETLSGRYRLVEVLGTGGMGAVYKAVTPGGAEVAVKLIRSDQGQLDDQSLRRFLREARATGAVDHPNVVRILDTGTDASTSTPYFVMELLSGDDLGAIIKEQGALEPALAAAIFVQACEGLAALHGAGIVHRDIKPSNLFLHRDPSGALVVKVCDLGVAKHGLGVAETTATDLTGTGGMLGSPHYMSPEQVQDSKHVDALSDIWSICMALYEALAGVKGWGGCSTVGEMLVAICTRDVKRLSVVAPWVPSPLARVVHAGLRRERAERIASAVALAAALAPLAAPRAELTVARLGLLGVSSDARAARHVPLGPSGGPLSVPAPSASGVETIAASVRMPEAPQRRPSRTALYAAVAAALAAAGGLSLAATRWTDATRTPPVPLPQPSTPVAATARGRLSITPPDATVTVDGAPVRVERGAVWIEAPVGVLVRVVASRGDVKIEASVMVGQGGEVVPPGLEVPLPSSPEPPAPSASAPARVVVVPQPTRAAPVATHAPTSTPPAATPTTATPGLTLVPEWQ